MILIHSASGDLAPLARRMRADGFPATLYIADPFARRKRLYRGLVPQFDSWEQATASRPEAIIFDMTHSGEEVDRLRTWIPVWGGGTICDALEEDRGFGLRVMLEHGIRIPHTVVFSPQGTLDWRRLQLEGEGRVHYVRGGIPEARMFLRATGGKWVLKPFGTAPTSLTYVGHSPEDLDRHLEEIGRKGELKPDMPFALQKFIPGVEVSTEVIVVNGEIVPSLCNSTLETKKFFPGDLGEATGAQTSLSWFYGGDHSALVRSTVGNPQMRAWLRRPIGPDGRAHPPYHAPLDLNAIVSEEDRMPYGIEWTPRTGYSAVYAAAELIEEPFYHFWLSLAIGKLQTARVSGGFGYALQMNIPPYPIIEEFDPTKNPNAYWELTRLCTDVPILGPVNNPHVWLLDAKYEDGRLTTAGTDGRIAEISGRGDTIQHARDSATALWDEVDAAEKRGRKIDGADSAINRLAKLEAWNYQGAVKTTYAGV